MHRHQAHRCRRRHRPEPADHDANQGPAGHIGQVIRCHRNDAPGKGHDARQAKQQRFSVKRACQSGNKQAGHHRKRAGNGNSLPGHTFGDLQGLRHRCQEADRHKFGGNQGEDAQRHSKHAAPVRLLFFTGSVLISGFSFLITHLAFLFC